MTARLKDIKEPPLLSAPPGEGLPRWLALGVADVSLMDEGLERCRKEGDGLNLAGLHFFMRGLGVGDGIGKGDGAVMGETLRKTRVSSNDWRLAELLHYMRGIGAVESPTGRDRVLMEETLGKAREAGNGLYVGLMHYCMRELGVDTVVTADDKNIMEKELKDLREERVFIAHLPELLFFYHTVADKKGLEDGDLSVCRSVLERAREQGDALLLAETHYYLRMLLNPPNGETRAGKMPPLREFGKRTKA